MSKVSLSKFQSATGLSDHSVLWLLKENHLPIDYTSEQGIMVDINSNTVQEVVHAVVARQQAALSSHDSILKEACSRVIREKIEEIFEDAIDGYTLSRS